MARAGGTEVELGMGIESVAGTAVASTVYPKFSSLSLQDVTEKSMNESKRGVRNANSSARVRRKYAEGSIEMSADTEIAPYLLGLALGKVTTPATATDGAYTHTVEVEQKVAAMKTATVRVKHGDELRELYTNVVCQSLNLEVSDGYAQATLEMLGRAPSNPTTLPTASYREVAPFAYDDMEVRFGASVATARNAGATPLKSFAININNNVLLDEAFLSGSNQPVAGGFCAGNIQITGSYSLHLDGADEYNKYKNDVQDAAVVSLTGGSIGRTSKHQIILETGKLVRTTPPKEINLDGLIVLNQEFEIIYDATDKELVAKVVNTNNGSAY